MNAELTWKTCRSLSSPRPLALLCAALLATGARAEVVLTVAPEENNPPAQKGAINVPKPKDDTGGKSAPVKDLSDALKFINNDLLHGSLVGIDDKNGVRWKNPEAKEPIEFKTTSVAQIKLQTRVQTRKPHPFSVRLTNDDELLGDIETLDSEKLEIETWYAGKLTIPRKMIRSITPLHSGALTIYEGPTGLEGWKATESKGAWQYKDGALVATSSGPIGRDFKLPDLSNIEFDVSWRPYLQLMVSLYTDTIENYGGNCYMLQLNSNYCYLQKMKPNGGSSNLGQVQLESLQRKSKAHLAIRVNKEAKTISLLLDGEMVKQWTDRGEFAGKGGGVVFYSQGQGLMKVSNIRITPWDGKFEDKNATGEKSKEDMVRLENNDKVSGRLETIKDGNMQFSSSFAKLEIPLKRIEQIEFSTAGAESPKRAPTDVRAFFLGRGQVTFALEKWDDKGVSVKSATFGAATFAPQAFDKVLFNLDQQPAKEGDEFDSLEGDENQGGGGVINHRGRGMVIDG